MMADLCARGYGLLDKDTALREIMGQACGGAELSYCLDSHVKWDNVAIGDCLTAIAILVVFDTIHEGEDGRSLS